MLVAWLTADTVRPGMAPPDASDTMPVTVARPVCAVTVALRMSAADATEPSRETTFARARIGNPFTHIKQRRMLDLAATDPVRPLGDPGGLQRRVRPVDHRIGAGDATPVFRKRPSEGGTIL